MWGLPREGDVLDCGAQDCFSAAGVSRFSHQPRCCVCICVPNPGESKKSPHERPTAFFSFLEFIFFFFPFFGSKKDELRSKAASPANAGGMWIISLA